MYNLSLANKLRDLTEHTEALKRDLERNKSLLEEKTVECQRLESHRRTPPTNWQPIEKDPMSNVLTRDVNPNPLPHHYPRQERSPLRHPETINIMPHHHMNHQPGPQRSDYIMRMQKPPPSSVIVHQNLSPGTPVMPPGSPAMPLGPAAMYPKDPQLYPGPHIYKQSDYGYK